MMRVPFVDLGRLHEPHVPKMLAAFERVLRSGHYVQGAEVHAFEREAAATFEAGDAIATNNGTSALHVALLACGVGAGDEVITVANTFIATAEAISAVGATPVFADIVADGYAMDPADIEHRITPRTRAIIVVHLYGEMADMGAIMAIARRNGLKVIEDACQAHGASIDGVQAGTIGDAGCLSFYPTKNLGAVGEGGMVLTNSPEIAGAARRVRDHGQSSKHVHEIVGHNFRMPELQAAGLRVLLPHLAAWNEQRRRIAGRYLQRLAGTDLVLPHEPSERYVYHLFVVRDRNREGLGAWLAERGIASAVHYPVPIHFQPCYADLGAPPLPHTEAATREILSLPFHPLLSDADIDAVAEAVMAWSRATRRPEVFAGA